MNKKYTPPPPNLLRTSNYHDSNGSDSFKQDCSNVKKIHTKNKTFLETQTVGEFVLPTCLFFSMGPLGFPQRSEYF